MYSKQITDLDFESEVIRADVPVVVGFSSDFATPCQLVEPYFDELSQEYGNSVKIAKLDIDKHTQWADKLGVKGIPSFYIFKNGELVSEKAGAAPKAALRSWIDLHVAS